MADAPIANGRKTVYVIEMLGGGAPLKDDLNKPLPIWATTTARLALFPKTREYLDSLPTEDAPAYMRLFKADLDRLLETLGGRWPLGEDQLNHRRYG